MEQERPVRRHVVVRLCGAPAFANGEVSVCCATMGEQGEVCAIVLSTPT